jgi:hypothetical protein
MCVPPRLSHWSAGNALSGANRFTASLSFRHSISTLDERYLLTSRAAKRFTPGAFIVRIQAPHTIAMFLWNQCPNTLITKQEMRMRVGFIGLGQMGSGMARSLIRAGHEAIAFNRTRCQS